MRMRDYWNLIHSWNDHRRHGPCMVVAVHIPPGAPKRHVDLAGFLALDFASAASYGLLEPHSQAMAKRKRVAA